MGNLSVDMFIYLSSSESVHYEQGMINGCGLRIRSKKKKGFLGFFLNRKKKKTGPSRACYLGVAMLFVLALLSIAR